MKHSRNSVTSIEVAKLAGVSQSSVSRAFSHEGPVSVKTRRKVLDAARKLGYQPNAMMSFAQKIASGGSLRSSKRMAAS